MNTKAVNYILARLKEKSTWVWIAGLGAIIGVPQIANIDAAAVAAVFAGIGMMTKEGDA